MSSAEIIIQHAKQWDSDLEQRTEMEKTIGFW